MGAWRPPSGSWPPCSSPTSSARRRSASSRTRSGRGRCWSGSTTRGGGDRPRRRHGREVRRRRRYGGLRRSRGARGPRRAGAARGARDAAADRDRVRRGARAPDRCQHGEVVSGRAREGSSFVTGDAVNVAARLEQASEPGAIVVGARTAEAVRGAFELGPAFEVDAKGKSEPVVAQTLVRALTLMRPRGLRGGARAFVGRDTELALLQAIYRHAAEQREPHVVTLMGDAGVGKTTLVRELWGWLADQAPQPLQRTGRCLAYGHVTYWALGEILREQLGLLENEEPGVGPPAARRPRDPRPRARARRRRATPTRSPCASSSRRRGSSC